jgi:hypothetical protein
MVPVMREPTESVCPCRDVTPAEITHYQKFGWVKLSRFIAPKMAQTLLELARIRMGEDGDSTEGISQPYFTVAFGGGLDNPAIRPLINGIGKNAKALMDRQSDVGTRYFSDFFAPKLPASRVTKHAGNGPTAFHQDFITFGVDRSGGMTFWIPLEAYGPEAGTMSFISESHRTGVIGSYRTYGDGDARDIYPELRELEMSDPVVYDIGDITVHSHLTVHGAGENQLDKPRWAYIILAQPADVCWNGAPSEAFDPTGMEVNQPLADERFPIIG